MRLLIIHQAFVDPKQGGGTRHYEFAQKLLANGHQVTVVASNVGYLSGTVVTAGQRLVTAEYIGQLRVLRAYTLQTLHRSFVWRVVAFLSFMLTAVWAGLRAGPVDVVMGTSPPIFQAVSAWLVAVLRRKPFLLEIRDLWPEFAIDLGVLKNPVLITLSRWLERFLYARADHLLVNSPAYRDYLLNRNIPPEKISLIPNGVDPAMFSGDQLEAGVRAELGLNGQFVVTYAGALGLANDIPTVLRAADRLRNRPRIHFLLVGDGKERPNLEQMARELQLPNVTFTGSRPKSDMPAMLAASDACMATLQNIPMFKTTYPNKVFDYMAAGRPTILAIDGVIRQVIEAAHGGVFVPPGDDQALANAVLNLSRQPEQARQMGQQARAYVTRHFNRETHAREFMALVERLAQSPVTER